MRPCVLLFMHRLLLWSPPQMLHEALHFVGLWSGLRHLKHAFASLRMRFFSEMSVTERHTSVLECFPHRMHSEEELRPWSLLR